MDTFDRARAERPAQTDTLDEVEVDKARPHQVAIDVQADAVAAFGGDAVVGRRLTLAAIDLAGAFDEPGPFEIVDDVGQRLRTQPGQASEIGSALRGLAAQKIEHRLAVQAFGELVVLAETGFSDFHAIT